MHEAKEIMDHMDAEGRGLFDPIEEKPLGPNGRETRQRRRARLRAFDAKLWGELPVKEEVDASV